MSADSKWHPDTLGVHAGQPVDPETGAVANPLHMSTTFERDADGDYRRGFVYGRSGNPTRARLEAALASLEGGKSAAAFGSGMAAISAVLMALNPGDHVILPKVLYHGVATLMEGTLSRWGLAHTRADMTDPHSVRAALTPETRMIWTETPANPGLEITSVRAMADLARGCGATLVTDATWPTPIMMQPITLGADIVVHSTTKYLAGHSDVTGGAVIARDEDHPKFRRVRTIQSEMGAVPSPFDCWLTLRGLQSLGVRVRAQAASAARVAEVLEQHSKVARTLYPGLGDHPGHETATTEMPGGYGGMLSFIAAGGETAARKLAASVRLIKRATSLGGTHTLIEHRATIAGESPAVDRGLLRLSLGLEHTEDIIKDLEEALDTV